MLLSEIRATVKSIIMDKLGVNESEFTPHASFANDLGVYPLDLSKLVMEFERKFNISISEIHFKNLKL